jgi:hypothetical protein
MEMVAVFADKPAGTNRISNAPVEMKKVLAVASELMAGNPD